MIDLRDYLLNALFMSGAEIDELVDLNDFEAPPHLLISGEIDFDKLLIAFTALQGRIEAPLLGKIAELEAAIAEGGSRL